MDVLSASENKIAWYSNTDGIGSFGEQKIIAAVVSEWQSVHATDVDGDSDVDVLSVGGSLIAWYENTDGRGTFGEQQIITTEARGAESVYAADLDGDGDMDVLSASFRDSHNKVAWYENTDGRGTFGEQQIITTEARGAESVYAADLDGDGDMDVLSASRSDDKIAWYENTDGRGTFGEQRVITTAADAAQSVRSADLDGDGDMDVLSASGLDDKIAWYENTDGRGTFGEQQIITTEANAAQSVHLADLDADNDVDVLSAGASLIAWYENTDGRGTFGEQPIVVTKFVSGSRAVFSADLDGDGDMDVLSASGRDAKIAWYENVSILPGDANRDLRFDQKDIVQVLQAGKYLTGESASFEEGDWNNDGVFDELDIVVAQQTGNYLQGPYAARPASRTFQTENSKVDSHAEAVDTLMAELL